MKTRTTADPWVREFYFQRLHIPTGQRSDGWHQLAGEYRPEEYDALVLINKWNNQQWGVWHYVLT